MQVSFEIRPFSQEEEVAFEEASEGGWKEALRVESDPFVEKAEELLALLEQRPESSERQQAEDILWDIVNAEPDYAPRSASDAYGAYQKSIPLFKRVLGIVE